MATAPATARDRGSAHPLDPLSGEEIAAAVAILRTEAGVGDSARFVYVTLDEPSKRDVAEHMPGTDHERRAHVVVRDLAERAT
jgi:primary-amine oxidase